MYSFVRVSLFPSPPPGLQWQDHEWLMVRTGYPLTETAPDGWMYSTRLRAHWDNTVNCTGVLLSSFGCWSFLILFIYFFLKSAPALFHLLVGTPNINLQFIDHLRCVWWGKYLVESVQRHPVEEDRTSAIDNSFSNSFYRSSLFVMCVEWKQRNGGWIYFGIYWSSFMLILFSAYQVSNGSRSGSFNRLFFMN